MTVMTTFAITLGTIYYLSYLVMGNSWTFMYSTLGFTLAVPELTPNMGLFWYFFTEMFEHFRVFFVCTFQINCFVYVYPLASRLKNQVLHFRSYDWEKLLKFEADGREFGKILRSLEQFVGTVKGLNNFWQQNITFLTSSRRFLRFNK